MGNATVNRTKRRLNLIFKGTNILFRILVRTFTERIEDYKDFIIECKTIKRRVAYFDNSTKDDDERKEEQVQKDLR
jgi:hypothetical protein